MDNLVKFNVLNKNESALLRGASYPFMLGHTPYPPGFKHKCGIEVLYESALSCELCAIIHECLGKFIGVFTDYMQNDEIARSVRPFGSPGSFQLWLCARRQDAPGFLIYTDSSKNNDIFEVGEVAFGVRNEDSTLHHKFPGRVIEDDPGTEKTLSRAREWLTSCQDTHPHCRRSSTKLPTRILDVQSCRSDGMVKLLDTGEEHAIYATLSYCWGTSGNLLSTTKTVELHRQGIKTDTLPKTIQDAVVVTQFLGLKYLWVDALCIIQDDPQDWSREARNMAQVYANAYINISALGAADTSQGCFMRRSPRRGPIPLDYHGDDGTRLKVFATIVTQPAMGTEKRDLGGYPISSRAWTLQERMLARRTLHFGNDQMFFECAWGFRCEDGYTEPTNSQQATSIPETLSQDEQPTNRGDIAGRQFSGYKGWATLINIYGRRHLTKSSDKLPAFSGLAQRYEGLLQDVYVAGLWKSRLVDDLHWSAEEWCVPADWRAPSWSWMSIDGPVHMPDMQAKEVGQQQCAAVLDYRLQHKDQNEYGELTGGWLKLEAPVAEVVDDEIFGFRPGQGGLSVYVEIPEELFDRLRIFTLFLYTTDGSPWTGLLITPVGRTVEEGVRTYRRVGKFLVTF
ncbi:heterokaryon incompatibility protein-domain-containing protein [Camillea tinctor]|nr:heterokaryon incompatibility protein-domain-containing protein [Camillea tinctor]